MILSVGIKRTLQIITMHLLLITKWKLMEEWILAWNKAEIKR